MGTRLVPWSTWQEWDTVRQLLFAEGNFGNGGDSGSSKGQMRTDNSKRSEGVSWVREGVLFVVLGLRGAQELICQN
jgi:hypothetical protein